MVSNVMEDPAPELVEQIINHVLVNQKVCDGD